MDFLHYTYALIATVPFITFFFIYYILILFDKEKTRAFNWAIYVTSILLFSAVTAQVKVILNIEYGVMITFTWLLLIVLLLGFLQWKIKGTVNYKKIIISTSKLSFLSFGFFYIILIIFGLFVL